MQLNATEGVLFWVGKGGQRKSVDLREVVKIEAADSDSGVVRM